MKKRANWPRILYVAGLVALIVGAIDPLEGSIIIAAGSIMLAISTFMSQDIHRKLFALLALCVCLGVITIWYVSSLGGFDPATDWWWWVGIAPYPLGWIATIALILVRWFRQAKPSGAS